MIDIATILNSREQVDIEVKAAGGGIPNSIWETYSSFANTFGGTIVLGIEEERNTGRFIPRGVDNPQKMLGDIWNTLNNRQKISANILMEHHIYQSDYDGKSFIVIEIPRADRRDKPVYVGQDMFRGTYRRHHEGDYRCSAEEVKSMLRDQAETTQDSLILENLAVSDLNQESIYRYRILFNNLRPNHIWSRLDDEEFLLKIGAARKSREDHRIHPTLGGLIFFGDFITITDELPNYFLDYREHLSNETRWTDRVCSGDGTWSGNVFDFYYKVIDRLTADVRKPFRLDSNLLRIDDTSVHKSLREALANALIHADYYGLCGIVVDKEFRKIRISNPGNFRINVEDAIAGGISDARNSRIFNMFSLINVGERSGTGLCNVYHVWEEIGFPRPELKESVDPERIIFTLYLKNEDSPDENEDNPGRNEDNSVVKEDSPEPANVPVRNDKLYESSESLSKHEILILQAIEKNPEISVVKLGIQAGISKSSVERALRSLRDKGKIRREGTTRGKWIIL